MKPKQLLLCGALALVSSQAQSTIVDGVRQRPSFEDTTTGFAEGTEAYLYNVGAGQFFTQGNAWGTQASVGDEGRKVRFTLSGNGDYVMQDYCWRAEEQPGGYMAADWRYVFFDSETALFVDRMSANQANYYFAVEDNGTTFRLSTSSHNPTFGDYAGAGLYVGLTKNSSSTILSPFVDEDDAFVDWAFVSVENYEALASALEVYNKAQELKVWIDRIVAENGDASSLNSVYLDESSTIAQLEAAIQSAHPIYIQSLVNNAQDKENIDLTMALVNPDFENGETGWTVTAAAGGGYNGHQGNVRPGGSASNQCYEAWNNPAFDIYQKLTDMPVGVYEIEVQGFYRYGRDATAWNAYQAQNVDYVKPEGVPVYVYLNNNATNFVNIFGDNKQITNQSFYSNGSTDYNSFTKSGTPYYFPNGMASAAIAFSDGMFKQSAFGLIANVGDEFRIGVKGNSSQLGDSWVIWDNFKLYYRGFKAEVVQPILETAMTDLQQYANLLMGKTEYAALSKALTDAQTAITNQNGEAMFAALNDLYDVKESVIASKDLFLHREVATDLSNLQQAIAEVAEKKLCVATLQSAQTLATAIAGSTKYEGTEIDQLKSDVTDAINSLINSVALYEDLNSAMELLTSAATAKALQSLVGEATQLVAATRTDYDAGSIADDDVNTQITLLNNKAAAINASAGKYTSLSAAIGRLTDAIATASTDEARVAKSTLTKANLRLTASQKVYNEATTGNDDIDARVTSIDELITELTHSIELYRSFGEGLASLKTELDKQQKLSAATRAAAQQVYDTALAAYNEGTIDDDQVEAQVNALAAQNTALANSVQLYAQLAEAYPTLEDVINLKAMQTLVDEANELYTTASTGYAEGTIADADIQALIANIQAIIPQVQTSAEKYASLKTAIDELVEAVEIASAPDARCAKSTRTKAGLRLTASQRVYDEGSIADADIDARVETIGQLIEELTRSTLLYRSFATGLESLRTELDKQQKLAAATRAAAEEVYATALAAYNEGTVDDDQVEAQVNALTAQNTALVNSVQLYAQLAEAYPALEDVINLKALQTLVDEANELYTTTSAGYAQESIADADVNGIITHIQSIIPQVQASAEKYAILKTAIDELSAAVAAASTSEARLAKSTLTRANLRLTNSQELYDAGTIADADIDDRVDIIIQLVEDINYSVQLYQQFNTNLLALQTELAKQQKVGAAKLAAATALYDADLTAYNEGSIDDTGIEAENQKLAAAVAGLQSSAQLYAQLATALTAAQNALTAADGKVAAAMYTAAQGIITAAQSGYDEASFDDEVIPAEVAKLNNVAANLNKADGLDAKAATLTTDLATLDQTLAEVKESLAAAQLDLRTAYIESAVKAEITARVGEIEAELQDIDATREEINNGLSTDKNTLAAATAAMGEDHTAALSAAAQNITAIEPMMSDALASLEEMAAYLLVQPAQAIAASSNIVELKAEYGTFCSVLNLDFSQVEGLKAYIVSAYYPDESKILLTRVNSVPAGTGLVVVGTPGGRYEIPSGDGKTVVSNLLVGITRSKELPTTSDGRTNCILSDGSAGIGFYPTSGGILAAGKAYLPLPTEVLQSTGVKGVSIVFNDATRIQGTQAAGQPGVWYGIDGKMQQRKPTQSGVYVRDGKKVIVK